MKKPMRKSKAETGRNTSPEIRTWQRDPSLETARVAQGDPVSDQLVFQRVMDAVQRASEPSPEKPAQLASKTGIPDGLRTGKENAFQTDFSDVRVHANSSKAPSVGALAYTLGNDIHFAPGQFNPGTGRGRELLGHELTHVVQQRQGRVKPTGEVGGMPLNDDKGLEKEADSMGKRAAAVSKKAPEGTE